MRVGAPGPRGHLGRARSFAAASGRRDAAARSGYRGVVRVVHACMLSPERAGVEQPADPMDPQRAKPIAARATRPMRWTARRLHRDVRCVRDADFLASPDEALRQRTRLRWIAGSMRSRTVWSTRMALPSARSGSAAAGKPLVHRALHLFVRGAIPWHLPVAAEAISSDAALLSLEPARPMDCRSVDLCLIRRPVGTDTFQPPERYDA